MPLYMIAIQEGSVSERATARIADEITQSHATIMKVPKAFVRVIFAPYPRGCAYAAGTQATAVAVNCTLRTGHSPEEKAALLTEVWDTMRKYAEVSNELLAISLTEIPASDAMEMGQIMRPVAGG
jgi:phenylpyruvate tautomerase PptA (4-oxalocrotonate tautomerase family)